MKINGKYIYYIATGLLFVLFIVTRLWRINMIPSGLHIDEASMAYNAWSLSQYGVDRYLKSWPVYLMNFDGGQSAMYCYLCAGLFKLFGYHLLLIRLPAVFFSFLNLIFGMLIVRKLYPHALWPSLLAGLLITVCPYFILAGRFGLDCNLMLGMSTIFLYCFISAMESEKYRWYILAGISGGLVLYTYAISYLILPLFLLLSLIYIIWVKRFDFVKWVSMAIPMGFLAFPLILEQYVNAFASDEMRLGIFTVTKMATYRAAEIEAPQWVYFLQALIVTFRNDGFPYNSVLKFYNLYYITIPLVILGLVHLLFLLGKSLIKRSFSTLFYTLFWFLSILALESCLIANTNKINGIFLAVILLAVDGVYFLSTIMKKYSVIFVSILSVLYCISFVWFGKYYYFGGYMDDNYPMIYFDVEISDAVDFLRENPQYQNNGIYVDENPVFLALSLLESPYELRLDLEETDFLGYWHCGQFTEIEEGYNYIVQDFNVDFANTLRQREYTEIKYDGYSLFYWNGD